MPPLSLQEGSSQGHCIRRHRNTSQEHWRIGARVAHGNRHHPIRGRLHRQEDHSCQQDGPPLVKNNGCTRPLFECLFFQKERTSAHTYISYIALRERECIESPATYVVDAQKTTTKDSGPSSDIYDSSRRTAPVPRERAGKFSTYR